MHSKPQNILSYLGNLPNLHSVNVSRSPYFKKNKECGESFSLTTIRP